MKLLNFSVMYMLNYIMDTDRQRQLLTISTLNNHTFLKKQSIATKFNLSIQFNEALRSQVLRIKV